MSDSDSPITRSELTARVLAIVSRSREIPIEQLSIDSSFEQLGFDSLDGINLAFALEEELDVQIPDEMLRDIQGVRQIVDQLEPLLARAPAAMPAEPASEPA